MSDFQKYLTEAFKKNGISEFPDCSGKMNAFFDILKTENEKYNLTALKDENSAAVLHFTDSLLAEKYIPANAAVLDVGCGAGFPSIPLAVVREDIKVTALDSTGKKIDFVKLVKNELKLDNLTAVCDRAEEFASKGNREKFGLVISRGVSAMKILCELCLPLVKPEGLFLAMKGPGGEEETKEAARGIKILGGEVTKIDKMILRGFEEDYNRTFVIIKKVKNTPEKYPRKYSAILKKPL